MLTFSIAQWQARAPEIRETESWNQWAQNPYCPIVDYAAPSLAFLPPMQRRRLSPMARMVFDCAWPLAKDHPPMPFVFASQHGETTRIFDLNQTLTSHEPLSPTSFGLSVHNSIAGLWSIIRGDKTESVALSVADDGLEHAVIEGALLLNQGANAALIVVTEEVPPAAYAPWINDVPFPYAVALRIEPGTDWQLEVRSGALPVPKSPWPNPLNLIRHLCLGSSSFQNTGGNHHWRWSRNT